MKLELDINKIEKERERLGISKSSFSRKLGLSASAYIKMTETRSTRIKTIAVIASLLNMRPNDILVLTK